MQSVQGQERKESIAVEEYTYIPAERVAVVETEVDHGNEEEEEIAESEDVIEQETAKVANAETGFEEVEKDAEKGGDGREEATVEPEADDVVRQFESATSEWMRATTEKLKEENGDRFDWGVGGGAGGEHQQVRQEQWDSHGQIGN